MDFKIVLIGVLLILWSIYSMSKNLFYNDKDDPWLSLAKLRVFLPSLLLLILGILVLINEIFK